MLWDVNDPENKRQTVEVYQNGSKDLSLFGIILHFRHNRFLCVKTVTKRRFNVPNGILFPLVCELSVWCCKLHQFLTIRSATKKKKQLKF